MAERNSYTSSVRGVFDPLPPEFTDPLIPEGVVLWLERIIPEVRPTRSGDGTLTPDERALAHALGMRAVVHTVRSLFESQQKSNQES